MNRTQSIPAAFAAVVSASVAGREALTMSTSFLRYFEKPPLVPETLSTTSTLGLILE
jgi:hypothetical protein